MAGPDPRVFTPARRAGRLLLEMVGEEEIEALDEGAADAAALAARPAPPPPLPPFFLPILHKLPVLAQVCPRVFGALRRGC